ncbi:hypothetical protein Q8G71_35940, partial [Klebsiella pneumoniae]
FQTFAQLFSTCWAIREEMCLNYSSHNLGQTDQMCQVTNTRRDQWLTPFVNGSPNPLGSLYTQSF